MSAHKRFSSEKLQSDVEDFEAAGGKIEAIEIGMSKFKSDIEKSAKRKNGKAKK